MKAFAWILLFIALAALVMTWVVGKEHVRSTVAAEQRAMEARGETLKAERERLSKTLNEQRQAYLDLEVRLDELETAIAEADATIAESRGTGEGGDALSAEAIRERTDLIMQIAAKRQAIEQLQDDLDALKEARK